MKQTCKGVTSKGVPCKNIAKADNDGCCHYHTVEECVVCYEPTKKSNYMKCCKSICCVSCWGEFKKAFPGRKCIVCREERNPTFVQVTVQDSVSEGILILGDFVIIYTHAISE